ncbi:MAG: NUDIX domain-containing protein, partial [Nanoarchaeota archaeon]
MATAKTTLTPDGQKMHYSVGAVIERNGLYLLIDRAKPPFGFAGIAGHVDEGESAEQAIIREVREESGLVVKRYSLVNCERPPPVSHDVAVAL